MTINQMLRKEEGTLVPIVKDFMLKKGKDIMVLSNSDIGLSLNILSTQSDRGEDRSKRTSFSAGATSNCMREQVITLDSNIRQDVVLDPRVVNIFDDGNWRNIRWVVLFNKMGILVESEVTRHNSQHNIGYTPDAIVDLSEQYPDLEGANRIGVEIKGMNMWEFQKFKGYKNESKWAYKRYMQVHSYMLATGAPFWIVWGENKNTQDFAENIIYRDEETIKFLKLRLGYMKAARNRGILPAIECELDDSDIKFKDCRQSEACVTHKTSKKLKPLHNRGKLEREAMRRLLKVKP